MVEINRRNRGSMYFAPKTASKIFHMIILGLRTPWISFGEIKIMEVRKNWRTCICSVQRWSCPVLLGQRRRRWQRQHISVESCGMKKGGDPVDNKMESLHKPFLFGFHTTEDKCKFCDEVDFLPNTALRASLPFFFFFFFLQEHWNSFYLKEKKRRI